MIVKQLDMVIRIYKVILEQPKPRIRVSVKEFRQGEISYHRNQMTHGNINNYSGCNTHKTTDRG